MTVSLTGDISTAITLHEFLDIVDLRNADSHIPLFMSFEIANIFIIMNR